MLEQMVRELAPLVDGFITDTFAPETGASGATGRTRAAGYRRMLLDTSIRQIEAQTLYRRLGFRDIEPYYELPEELRDWLVFMELPLRP